MFGFLAALGPVGIAAAVVGTVGAAAYGAMSDDDYETTTYSNKSEKEAEARRKVEKTKKENLLNEIESYKKAQSKRLKKKYDVNIKFNKTVISGSNKNMYVVHSTIFSSLIGKSGLKIAKEKLNHEVFLKETVNVSGNNTDEDDIITKLEDENKEILKLIKDLETAKDETIL